uniref:Cyclin-dependent kinases regulatory subunit n=1 Tax=Spermophilus dauricus TaxID=99837 RepID=A0A8C9PHM0_SPEDA
IAHKQIFYFDKCFDNLYEYQHVMLPRGLPKQVAKTHLFFLIFIFNCKEWRRLGAQQSLGWVHYVIHEPELHILLLRCPIPKRATKMKCIWDHLNHLQI